MWTRRDLLVVMAVSLCGCLGDDDSSGGPTTLQMCVGGADLAAYRDGSGPWVPVAADATGVADITVHDTFESVTLTGDTSFVFFWHTRTTVAEAQAALAAYPFQCTLSGAIHDVSGTLAQPGTVAIGGYWEEVSAAGAFSIESAAGTHDFVATADRDVPTASKVIIRRDVAVTGDTALGAIDVGAQGVALTERSLSIEGVTLSELSTVVALMVDEGATYSEVSQRTRNSAAVVPDSALALGDEQWIYVRALDRGADIRYTGSETSATLLAPLEGITFSAGSTITATWSALPLPDYQEVALNVYGQSMSGGYLYQYTQASAGFVARTGAASLGIDTSFPGYDATWQLDPAVQHDVRFTFYGKAIDNVQLHASAADVRP